MSDAMEVDSEVDGPRGAKRKADALDDNTPQRRIKPLDEDVINKIAAGEIIVAPVNALKELMENSVDAGSTTVDVSVKEGGLKLLQITDNGSGIEKEDLPILCQRFTTSKLQKFEDLQTIATYGFRGEALASISHIAHLTVTTKTRDSECAWRGHYGSGVLVPAKPGQSPDPKPVSGRQGTQITVEDLFFNVPTRRRAFRSPANEYNKILDMVGRYAIHCTGVGFTCKKHGESSKGISVSPTASCLDRIRQIYGASVANELTEFETKDDQWGFKAKGLATNANYRTKKTTLLLFINNRCVESTNIRKALEQTYASFLPKNGHPFVYLSLEIDPRRVDVNVHPTKQEVNFLNEDETIQAVCEHLRSKLAEVDASRTFLTQTLLPASSRAASSTQLPPAPSVPSMATPASSRRAPPRSDTSLVRTDTNLRKITSMLPPARPGGSTPSRPGPEPMEFDTAPEPRQPTSCHLHSIKELRAEVREEMHNELTDIFANHTFVGIVDERRRLAAIQAGVKLYMIDYGRVCYEYFYQSGLTDFGNFGVVQFQPPLDIRNLLSSSPNLLTEYEEEQDDDEEEDIDPEEKAEIIEAVVEKLIERREMLLEYFSLEVSPAGELCSVPLLVNGYEPPLTKLPGFLVRLGPCVNWTEEKACFESFLKELAGFYVPERLPLKKVAKEEDDGTLDSADERKEDSKGEEEKRIDARRRNVKWALEHVLFPAFKARLVGTKGIMEAGGVVEVADLKGLYRVFERC
ncbi:Putative DNA mismatch repair protein Mlh1 [Podospora comata]|uniref:DNA mismatch repair protein Mlh1 n=1 Tax=Podospora comata TaxID=48703 RepID=A0ABY6SGH6_PODCO|nr:Putative DNA mismatch repair protein Mlh1 [Podospora comata]